ncbi:MAG: thymidine phosphorylase [Planctomycetota bacterium]|nr:thymidine phosphorylase [Planctomycetota bacterium]
MSQEFLPQEIIRRKRDGEMLPPAAIQAFVAGLTDGTVGDAQVGAFAMAVHFQGMTREECVALTAAMTASGEQLTWPDLDGPVLDKHSTGGIGDKVSLMLAPIVAACGGYVPMISGRGLGHTGGTLDKLESIPGYDVAPSPDGFRSVVREAGCAIIGQTGELAPADDRFYSIRDVTATVDPIALITASILSKKLAAGLGALVMDVKFGSGAFSRDPAEARELAASLVDVACGAGLPTGALITDMNQVLGRTAGNAVEVRETIDFLTGTDREARLDAVVAALAAELLVMGDLAPQDEALLRVEEALTSGAAAERFQRMVTALGGPADLLERPDEHLPRARVVEPVFPEEPGFVCAIDGRRLGMLLVELGAGRRNPEDTIDPTIGVTAVAGLGERLDAGMPLCLIHARDEAQAKHAGEALRACFVLGPDPVTPGPVVLERMGASE